MEGLFGFLLVAIPIFLIVRHFMKKSATREAFAALPEDGPMQVKLEEVFTPPGSFNSKQIPCELKIDVTISQKDWQAIANAGLMKKVLFQADGLSGKKYDPDNMRDWLVEDLKRPTIAPFWDTDRMHQAKEQLITSLHTLRAHIDGIRQGPKTDSFEV